jgi:hypothetical protein
LEGEDAMTESLPNETNETYWRRRREAFREKMEEVMTDFHDVVGPRTCPIHGEDMNSCDHEPWDMELDPNSVLANWFVAYHYIVMNAGFSADKDVDYIDFAEKRGQGRYATLGIMECLKNSILS